MTTPGERPPGCMRIADTIQTHHSLREDLAHEEIDSRIAEPLASGGPDVPITFASIPAAADTILFTASTDSSGMAYPVSAPALIPTGLSYPVIPSIDPTVTLNPNPALLDGNVTGPLDGVIYGPTGFGFNTGGNTGWVNISYTVPTAGQYELIWEVAGADYKIGAGARLR